MRFSLLTTVATASLAAASPLDKKAEISAPASLSGWLTPEQCRRAESIVHKEHGLRPFNKWCTKFLDIHPRHTTVTSTYYQLLTEVDGVPTTVYGSAAPPGTTTVVPHPVTNNGTGTITQTSTKYTFSERTYTPSPTTTTKEIECTTTEPAGFDEVRTACRCIGATTPTYTTTVVETTTGSVTEVTETVTYLYPPTTTYAPVATVTESTSRETIYATYVTLTVTSTSTNVFEQPASQVTDTVTTCTATSTVTKKPGHY